MFTSVPKSRPPKRNEGRTGEPDARKRHEVLSGQDPNEKKADGPSVPVK